jgi:putative superfamily III holin-X
MSNTQAQERSLGELFAELSRETSDLVRHELTLAKAELSQKAARVGKDVGLISMGGALAYAGLLALVAALVIGLADAGLEWWASALIVGVVVTTGGYISTQKGLTALRREQVSPTETIDTLKENAQWAKGQIR